MNFRDAQVAVFIDHLDNGHCMAHKVLAAEHPHYGQQAMRTSLNHLIGAGHLRWIKEHITLDDNTMRWVTRTYWSRTPRSVEWWAEFARGRDGKDVTQDCWPGLARAEDPAPEPAPEPSELPELSEFREPSEIQEPSEVTEDSDEPSAAYCTLALLRITDPRMPLSEAECRTLEPLAAQWLARGATQNDITRALTDGLPPTVTNPGGLARRRLETKMPPEQIDTACATTETRPVRARVTRVIMACGTCDQDERTVEIDRGICVECRAEFDANPMTDEDIAKGFEEIAHDGVMAAYFLKKKLERATGGPVPDTFRPVPIDDLVMYHFRDNRERIANGLPPRRWNWARG